MRYLLAGLGIALAATITPSPSYAGEPVGCPGARLSTLVFETEAGTLGPDYCQSPPTELPAPARAVLAQVSLLNRGAALVFGMTPETLLSKPFALKIVQSPFGPLVSTAQNISSQKTGAVTWLTIGVYLDGDAAPVLNAGVYTHELGHVIGMLPSNPALPRLYRELVDTPLMLEMMADLTAFHATGAIVSPESGIPACLQAAFRKIEPDVSYAQPAEFFTAEHSARVYDACCLSLDQAHAHTSRSQAFCREHLKGGPTDPSKMGSRLFDLAFYQNESVDGHRLGLPLNSFLFDLEREAGLDAVPLLLRAMRSAESLAPLRFVCEVPKLRTLLKAEHETRPSLSQVFERLRADLPQTARAVYDRLWRSHRMDMAVMVADEDARIQAAGWAAGDGADAYNALYSAPPGQTPDPRARATSCWEAYSADVATPQEPGQLDDERPGCSWECHPEPAK